MRIKNLIRTHKDTDAGEKLDSDLDALMDKYDENEKKPVETKKESKKTTGKDGKADTAAVQDAELSIL